MKTIYLGLGSNIGDRRALLEDALQRIAASGITITKRSTIVETEPAYVLDQPRFLNMVIEAQTTLMPRALLQTLQRIEREMGRRIIVDKGPRSIDIDILFYSDIIMRTKDLTIPHALLHERRFVLEPLNEIAPQLVHPVLRKTVAELCAL
ncbi:MAG: 2-amino-4-hydroxy-6-hydroxymethyldihydropteridine diphosphokinase [Acidobacteria bacterium]|nr:2-amino-4-hydroxy-6-hydroxymethyldihydropteridine diphosphokinase [Acidobacteriota bacterium]